MGLRVSHSSSRMLAILAMVATTALWGVSYPLIKQLVDSVPPCTLAALRLTIALAVLIPVLLMQGGRPHIGWPSVLLGVTGVAAFQLFQNVGMERMPAGLAVIVLFGSAVIFTTLLGWVLLGETCSTPMLLALLGSAAGVAVVAVSSDEAALGFPAVGLLLIMVSALAFSIYAVIGRRYTAGSLNELNAGALIVGLVVMLPFVAHERPDTRSISLGGGDLLALIVLGAVVTAGTYSLWSYSIRHLQANEASVLCSIEPAFGLFFAWVLLRESISPQEMIGAAVIVASCVLVARGESTSEPEPVVVPAGAGRATALPRLGPYASHEKSRIPCGPGSFSCSGMRSMRLRDPRPDGRLR